MESRPTLAFGFGNREQYSSVSSSALSNPFRNTANANYSLGIRNNKDGSHLFVNNSQSNWLSSVNQQGPSAYETQSFYKTMGPADETTPPTGLESFSYGSNNENNPNLIVPPATDLPYIKAAIGTPPLAGELYMSRTANLFNEAWQGEVASAIEKNGGLGTAEDGYLSFSKIGFVRLKNENLSAEQNRQLAAISLQLGIPIEDLPSRCPDNAATNPDINTWVNEFLDEHNSKFSAFLQNPAAGYSLKDGRHLYHISVNSQTGEITSSHEKLHGGIRGWCAKNMKWLSPTLDAISTVTSFIPGWGKVASVASNGLKAAGNMIAAGKFKASELFSFVTDSLPLFKGKLQKFGGKAVSWIEKQFGKKPGWLADQAKYLGIDLDKILGRDKKSSVGKEANGTAADTSSPATENANIFEAIEKPVSELAEVIGLKDFSLSNLFK
ncbi:MAG: hypothetical protein IT292_12215 [Deltaproteobacteria bacterium]|nr:hypothetical protein [Deltaproteobacteria bacterium]